MIKKSPQLQSQISQMDYENGDYAFCDEQFDLKCECILCMVFRLDTEKISISNKTKTINCSKIKAVYQHLELQF